MQSSSRWLFSLVLLLGCEDPPPELPPPLPPGPPPAPIAGPRGVADDAAFAIVPSPDGALLFWAVPYREGGGVRVVTLSPTGGALGAERPVAQRGAAAGGAAEQHVSQAVELDAFSVGRRVALAWVLDYGHHLAVQATWSADGQRFATVETLGRTVRRDEGTRGRVAVSGDEDRLLVHHRTEEADCVASEGRCAMFARHGLDGATGRPGPSEVREPCEPLVGGALFRAGTWYDAVCHLEGGAPSTTIESVRPALSYAGPTTFAGCVPVALAPLDDGVLALGRCGDTLAGHALDEMGRTRASFSPIERVAACEDGRPVLRAREGRREAKLTLGAAIGRIEGLLPEDLAPAGARAVWTGEAILVAAPVRRSLILRRYQCRPDGRLDRTDAL